MQVDHGIKIRTASSRDAPAIAVVLDAAFATYRADYTAAAYRHTVPDAGRVADRLAEGPTWVAEQDGAIVGTVSALPRGDELYLRSLAVRPDARGSGLGERLITCVTEWAKASGFRRIRLDTTPFLTASRRLYLRCGFSAADPAEGDLHGTPLLCLLRELH